MQTSQTSQVSKTLVAVQTSQTSQVSKTLVAMQNSETSQVSKTCEVFGDISSQLLSPHV